jgi:3-oxoacyl-[acyl-carrier protein] reductase
MPLHEGRTEWTDVADLVALVVAAARGELDAWSGGFVRAGTDTVTSLAEAAARPDRPALARRLGLVPYGKDDPVAG